MAKTSQKGRPSDSRLDSFIWTNDEVELLLNIVDEYKVKQAVESFDGESRQSKYAEILSAFQKEYPSKDDAGKIAKEFPPAVNEVMKSILTSKPKSVRTKCRHAVDSGR